MRKIEEIEREVEAAMVANLMVIGGVKGDCEVIDMSDVIKAAEGDSEMKELIGSIRAGHALEEGKWPTTLREYSRVKGDLCEKDGVAIWLFQRSCERKY